MHELDLVDSSSRSSISAGRAANTSSRVFRQARDQGFCLVFSNADPRKSCMRAGLVLVRVICIGAGVAIWQRRESPALWFLFPGLLDSQAIKFPFGGPRWLAELQGRTLAGDRGKSPDRVTHESAGANLRTLRRRRSTLPSRLDVRRRETEGFCQWVPCVC